MSRHSDWRKTAKKLRRKRIRQAKAIERDKVQLEEQKKLENSPTYQKWLKDQESIEIEQAKEEAAQAAERERKWRETEAEAQKHWRELQKKLAIAREEKMKQNMKIKLEWEREEKRLKELKKAKEKELEEKRLQQQKREQELLDFLEQGGSTPDHLKTSIESNPDRDLCPFFQKVSACRFFDTCSRNHVRPGISRTLLITHFFSDLSLEIKENEHGSDVSLEYEMKDTYNRYKEFFLDVTAEMKKSGNILHFLTCCNHEAHLRGNLYIEYETTREALITYHKFNGRWYAGKQLNVNFCNIPSWRAAVCGLFFRNKCPKGNTCNFLHVFRNPGNMYMPSKWSESSNRRNGHTRSSRRTQDRSPSISWETESSNRRGWRWSESPERPVKTKRRESRSPSRDSRVAKRKSKKSRSKERSSKRRKRSSRSRSR